MIVENYLLELFGNKQFSKIREIEDELSDKAKKLINNGKIKCREKYKTSENKKLEKICKKLVIEKVCLMIASDLEKLSPMCDKNKFCLMKLEHSVISWRIHARNAKIDIEQLRKN